MSKEILICSGLGKRFGTRYALRDVELRVESGKIIGLLGPNGSGKTTLMKLANGLLKPEEGWIEIDGAGPDCTRSRWYPICRIRCILQTG